jgi:hypothetical protein
MATFLAGLDLVKEKNLDVGLGYLTPVNSRADLNK